MTEDDNRYWMGIEKTASDRFFIVSVESKETTEAHIVDLEGVTGKYEHVYVCVCVCVRMYVSVCVILYDVTFCGIFPLLSSQLSSCSFTCFRHISLSSLNHMF